LLVPEVIWNGLLAVELLFPFDRLPFVRQLKGVVLPVFPFWKELVELLGLLLPMLKGFIKLAPILLPMLKGFVELAFVFPIKGLLEFAPKILIELFPLALNPLLLELVKFDPLFPVGLLKNPLLLEFDDELPIN